MVNVFSGGLHADGGVDIQDYLFVPLAASEVGEAIEQAVEVRLAAGDLLRERGLTTLLAEAGLSVTAWMEPLRYDPTHLLADPKLRARAAALAPAERAALAEALAGNISMHVLYCRRADEPVVRADPLAPDAVPVGREIPGPEQARQLQPDGGLTLVMDGLRVRVGLPTLAPSILALIDGVRSVRQIGAALDARGVAPEAFARAWATLFPALEAANRLLLAAPAQPESAASTSPAAA
jgi:hypothetical protein